MYVTKGEQVQDEEEGAKNRTLGDTLGEGSSGEFAVVDVDELVSVGEVGSEPGEGSVGDVEAGFKLGEKKGVIYGVKVCAEVKEDENIEVANIRGEE